MLTLKPAGARQQPGIERLDAMGIDALAAVVAGQQRRRRSAATLALVPAARTRKARGSPLPIGSSVMRAAARNGLAGDQQHVEQELDAVLRQQRARQVPGQLGLVVLEKAARHVLGVAEIDLRAGRAGGAEGDPAELQLGRGRCASSS